MVEFKNKTVISFADFEKKNYLRAKKCNDVMRKYKEQFIEGVDYFAPTRRELGCTGCGNPNIPVYLLTDKGQKKMLELCKDKRPSRKPVEPKKTFEKPELLVKETPVAKTETKPVAPKLSTEEILLQLLESQKTFQDTMLQSFQMMTKLMMNNIPEIPQVKEVAQPKEETPQEVVEDVQSFSKYYDEINALMNRVIKETHFSNKANLKSIIKSKLDKEYGICTAQYKADFYHQENRYPQSDIELFWWIEQQNPALKGILRGALGNYLQVEAPTFPIKNVDQLRVALEYIGNKNKDMSPYHSNTYRQFFDYVSSNSDIKWDKFENKIRRKYHRSAVAKVTKMECLECRTVREKCILLFNSYAEEKYRHLF